MNQPPRQTRPPVKHRVYDPALSHGITADASENGGTTKDSRVVGGRLTVHGPEAHHAVRVKRIGPGDTLEVFDGQGLIIVGTVEKTGKTGGASGSSLSIDIVQIQRVKPVEPGLIVAAPPPKGPRSEVMVDQLSQVGVNTWIPLQTQRTIVVPKPNKIDKWQRSAVESAKQSGRSWIMQISDVTQLADLIQHVGWVERRRSDTHHHDDPASRKRKRRNDPAGSAMRTTPSLVFLADSNGPNFNTFQVKNSEIYQTPQTILLVIGPEGGLTDTEREQVVTEFGAHPVRFGPHTLRVETAAILGAGLILCSATEEITAHVS